MNWRKTLEQLNNQLSSTYDSGVDSVIDRLGLEAKRDSSDFILPAISLFSAGIVVGAALGVLFAPKRGEEVRGDLRERLEDLKAKGSDRYEELRAQRLESGSGSAVPGVPADPQAGEVFLGDDLVSTKDYSDDTATRIDEEVGAILRRAEQRCREVLTEHRYGLDLVARALLEHETIAGEEVSRLLSHAQAGPSETVPNTAATLMQAPPPSSDL